MSFEHQLQQIAANVEVTGPDSYRLGEHHRKVYQKQAWMEYIGPLNQFGHNQSADTQQQKQLLEGHLCNALYAHMYCGMPVELSLENMPRLHEREAFMQTLSEVNHSSDQPDQNWKVYHADAQGAWASKNGKLRQAHANSYIPAAMPGAQNQNGQLAVNQFIHFLRQKENRHIQQVFYYVHGNQYLEHDAPQVRIYWHLKPEGAAPLVNLLTQVLNEHKIAFNFKCLNHPELYVRADSAVLYLEKRYFDYTLRVLMPHLASLEPYLKSGHPLFSQTIMTGVSFAEDPGNGQSFGMHRCQLLARALMVAYEKQLVIGGNLKSDENSEIRQNVESGQGAEQGKNTSSAQLRFSTMLEVMASKGISPDRLHLNPNTLSLPVAFQNPDQSAQSDSLNGTNNGTEAA